jgi:hypothetical protein
MILALYAALEAPLFHGALPITPALPRLHRLHGAHILPSSRMLFHSCGYVYSVFISLLLRGLQLRCEWFTAVKPGSILVIYGGGGRKSPCLAKAARHGAPSEKPSGLNCRAENLE